MAQPDEGSPGSQLAQGARPEHKGQQAAQQVTHAAQFACTYKGFALASLLLIARRELREHFLLPVGFDEATQLLFEGR